MTYVPVIDESACLAHGDCEEMAPEVFRVEDVATVIGRAPDEQLMEVARACPASAIVLVDKESGQQVYP
ncbi:MAG TPA: ferredoxin [Solirubrobacteraceae bacterium]